MDIVFLAFMATFGHYIIVFLFGADFASTYFMTLLMLLVIPCLIYSKIIGTLFSAKGK
ncbi:hypothetical protein [Listeria rocourtiae]|uniref:hypothetical protein n=1 Tax=Listeria rocourtiae TaxID=647910 RepID=UPI003D2F8542